MKHIREQDYVIALAIDGKTPDSVFLICVFSASDALSGVFSSAT